MIVMGIHKGTIVTGAMRKRHIPARSIGPALVVVLTIGAVATSGVATLGLTVPASFAQQPAATPGTSAVQGAPAAKAAPPPSAAPAGNAVGAGTAWKAEVKESGTQSGVTLDPGQLDAVKKVDAYFNALEILQGRFTQTTTADKKQTRGRFYVKKPGLFRFAYALPSKQVILSDGKNLTVEDHDIKQSDQYSIDSTPFKLLLRKDVNLLRDARVTDLQLSDDLLVLSIIDKAGDSGGQIKLVFVRKPTVELKEWVVLDAQGIETHVEVSDLDRTQPIDAKLFQPTVFGNPSGPGTSSN